MTVRSIKQTTPRELTLKDVEAKIREGKELMAWIDREIDIHAVEAKTCEPNGRAEAPDTSEYHAAAVERLVEIKEALQSASMIRYWSGMRSNFVPHAVAKRPDWPMNTGGKSGHFWKNIPLVFDE